MRPSGRGIHILKLEHDLGAKSDRPSLLFLAIPDNKDGRRREVPGEARNNLEALGQLSPSRRSVGASRLTSCDSFIDALPQAYVKAP
jgi:hypothetical protein